ncbi:hypothetical protein C8R21_1565 [Nitrosospira multiformis]|uniref:Uncharacterized protein n=1 Tax=Nitrosospira multiformis TaxID=1231 RepID=A0A2T5I056_9PROT|nr:hypothetical protein C8R21_1565 [Nitrosospira multiformis]
MALQSLMVGLVLVSNNWNVGNELRGEPEGCFESSCRTLEKAAAWYYASWCREGESKNLPKTSRKKGFLIHTNVFYPYFYPF